MLFYLKYNKGVLKLTVKTKRNYIESVERRANGQVDRVIASAGAVVVTFSSLGGNKFRETSREKHGGSAYIPPGDYNLLIKQVYVIFQENLKKEAFVKR